MTQTPSSNNHYLNAVNIYSTTLVVNLSGALFILMAFRQILDFAEKLAFDKRSSLSQNSRVTAVKSFIRLRPVANVIILFTAVSYDFS
jgi:hypothetical protein